MSTPNTEELIAKIERAFASVRYPGDDDLTNSSTSFDEPAALVRDFRGKTDWRKLDSAFLDQAPERWGSALSFFSANALRFYLPAYLISDIRGELISAEPALRLCSSLTGEARRIAKVWNGGTMADCAHSTFACFDAQQVAVIVAYLWWKLEEDDDSCDSTIEEAMLNYWLPRAEEEGASSVNEPGQSGPSTGRRS